MAEISNTMSLEDHFTPIMRTINNSMRLVINSMERLENTINRLSPNAINTTSTAMNNLSGSSNELSENIQDSSRELSRLSGESRELGQEMDGLGRGLRQVGNGTEELGRQTGFLGQQFTMFHALAVEAIKGVIAYAEKLWSSFLGFGDDVINTTSRLNLMNDNMQTTAELAEKIFLSAQRARVGYEEVTNTVASLGMTARNVFSTNEELISFVEILNKQFKIAGLSAENINNVMSNISRSMSSGVLRGEEFNYLLETSPMLLQQLAEGLGVTNKKLKEMADKGQISADILKNSVLLNAEKIEKEFNNMPFTFGDNVLLMRDKIKFAFEDISVSFNKFFSEKLQQAFQFLIGNIDSIRMALTILLPTLLVVSTVLTAGFIMANLPIIAVVGAISLLITLLNHFGITSEQILSFVGMLFGVFLSIVNNIFVSITDIVFGYINDLITVYSAFGEFFINFAEHPIQALQNLFMAFLEVVRNLFISIFKIIDNILGTNLVGAFNSFGNTALKIFNTVVNNIMNFFKSLASGVIKIMSNIAKAMDNLFGTSLASGLDQFLAGIEQKKIELKTKLEQESAFKKPYQEITPEKLSTEKFGLKRMGYQEAGAKGFEIGGKLGANLDNLGTKIKGLAGEGKISAGNVSEINSDLKSLIGSSADSGKALKTTGDVKIATEDIKLMLDMAVKPYQMHYNQITPEIIVNIDKVEEKQTVDSLIDSISLMIEEATETRVSFS